MKKLRMLLGMVCVLSLLCSNIGYAKTDDTEKVHIDGGKTLQMKVEKNQKKAEKQIQESMEQEKENIN